MSNELCIIIEEINNFKLLALFNTLEEEDKDIVINMSEMLLRKWSLSITNLISYKEIN